MPRLRRLSAPTNLALRELSRRGLLLLTDAKLPSLVGLIAGEPVRGSWWSHPRGGEIYRTASELEEHPDVLIVKLVAAKVTFVHRRLWPALAALATAREPWQMRGLSPAARQLLARVERAKFVRATGAAPRELEHALLVLARELHTESGAHARELSSFRRFAREKKLKSMSLADARATIEDAVAGLGDGALASVPWVARARAKVAFEPEASAQEAPSIGALK